MKDGAAKSWDYNVHFVYSTDLFQSKHVNLLRCGNSFEAGGLLRPSTPPTLNLRLLLLFLISSSTSTRTTLNLLLFLFCLRLRHPLHHLLLLLRLKVRYDPISFECLF